MGTYREAPSRDRPALRAGNRNSLAHLRRTSASSDFALSFVKGGWAPLSHFPPSRRFAPALATSLAGGARRRVAIRPGCFLLKGEGFPPFSHFLLFSGGEPAQRERVGAPASGPASPAPTGRAGPREANATGFRALARCRLKPAFQAVPPPRPMTSAPPPADGGLCRLKPALQAVAPYGRAAVSRLAAPPERVRNGRNVPGTLHVHPLFRGTGRWGLESSIADRKARVEDCRTRRFRTVRRLPDCRQRRRPGRRRAGLGTAAPGRSG